MVLHLADIVPILLRGDNLIMVLHTDLFAEIFAPTRSRCSCSPLSKPTVKVFLSAEIGGNVTGIHPAGKEATDLHVANLVGRTDSSNTFSICLPPLPPSCFHPHQILAPNSAWLSPFHPYTEDNGQASKQKTFSKKVSGGGAYSKEI